MRGAREPRDPRATAGQSHRAGPGSATHTALEYRHPARRASRWSASGFRTKQAIPAGYGKAPTTSVRCPISWVGRSRGCAPGLPPMRRPDGRCRRHGGLRLAGVAAHPPRAPPPASHQPAREGGSPSSGSANANRRSSAIVSVLLARSSIHFDETYAVAVRLTARSVHTTLGLYHESLHLAGAANQRASCPRPEQDQMIRKVETHVGEGRRQGSDKILP